MSAQGIRAGRAFVELGVNDNVTKALRRMGLQVKALGQQARAVGLGIAAAGAAIAAPLALATRQLITVGDQFDKMSLRTGVSVEALSQLAFAASQSGSSIESVEKALRNMARVLTEAGDGMGSAVDTLAALGLTAEQVAGMTPEEQFLALGDAISRIEDPTTRAARSLELFGKAGSSLLPLFAGGAEGVDALRKMADRLGLTIGTQTAKDAAALGDALDVLKRQVVAAAVNVGGALAPTITKVFKAAGTLLSPVIRLAKAFPEVVLAAGGLSVALVGAGVAVAVAGQALIGLWAASQLAIVGVGAIAAILSTLLSPMVLVGAGAVALAGTLLVQTGLMGRAMDFVRGKFADLAAAAGPSMEAIRSAIAAGDIAAALEVAGAALEVVWSGVIGRLVDATQGLRDRLVSVFFGIADGWLEATAAMRTAWAKFTGETTRLSAGLAQRAAELGVVVADKLGLDGVAAAAGGFETVFAGVGGSAAQRTAAEIRGIAQEAGQAQSKLRDAQAAADALLGAASSAESAEAQRRLETAKDRLDAAIRNANAAAENAGGLAERARLALDPAEQELESITRNDVESRVAFTSVRGLDASVAPLNRVAKASEATAANTKRLVDEIRNRDFVFG